MKVIRVAIPRRVVSEFVAVVSVPDDFNPDSVEAIGELQAAFNWFYESDGADAPDDDLAWFPIGCSVGEISAREFDEPHNETPDFRFRVVKDKDGEESPEIVLASEVSESV